MWEEVQIQTPHWNNLLLQAKMKSVHLRHSFCTHFSEIPDISTEVSILCHTLNIPELLTVMIATLTIFVLSWPSFNKLVSIKPAFAKTCSPIEEDLVYQRKTESVPKENRRLSPNIRTDSLQSGALSHG